MTNVYTNAAKMRDEGSQAIKDFTTEECMDLVMNRIERPHNHSFDDSFPIFMSRELMKKVIEELTKTKNTKGLEIAQKVLKALETANKAVHSINFHLSETGYNINQLRKELAE